MSVTAINHLHKRKSAIKSANYFKKNTKTVGNSRFENITCKIASLLVKLVFYLQAADALIYLFQVT